jgi:nicotinamidase-related amidase
MTENNPDLHGNAPDKADGALVMIDVINAFDFPDGPRLLEFAQPMAERLSALKRRAKAAGVPVIYVNDNFGRWRSDFRSQVDHCLADGSLGRRVVELLKPEDDDYFVIKPKHSGFFATSLGTLLQYLKTKTLILTGLRADICVLFTANEAYMRDYNLIIPADCAASVSEEENVHALRQMKKILKADVRLSSEVELEELGNSTSSAARSRV